jgi:hypothetical protein
MIILRIIARYSIRNNLFTTMPIYTYHQYDGTLSLTDSLTIEIMKNAISER